MREHTLKLVGGTFQVTDLEGQPLPEAPAETAEDRVIRLTEAGKTLQSSVDEPAKDEKIKINLAEWTLEALQEHWDEPQI